MNNTAERDLALQKERLAFLVHHVDWRDQFTFVLSLASPQAYFRTVLCSKPSRLPVLQHASMQIVKSTVYCVFVFKYTQKETLSEPECVQTFAAVPLRPFRGQCSSMGDSGVTNGGERKIGFSEFYPSLGSMQCLNYLLHLSIKVSLSVYCSH